MNPGAASSLLMITVLLLTTTPTADVGQNNTVTADRVGLPTEGAPDEPIPKCKLADTTPIDKNITLDLYAGDTEREFEDPSERKTWIRNNCNIKNNFSGLGGPWSPFQSDRTFEDPPGNLTTALNRYQFQNFSVGTGHYPNGDDIENSKKVRIYYDQARIFSIENATKVHQSQGDVQTYIPQNGTVRGFYHLNTTSRSTRPPFRAIFPVPYPRTWKLVPGRFSMDEFEEYGPYSDIQIKNVCVVADYGSCGSSNDVTTDVIYKNTTGPSSQLQCLRQSCNRTGKYALQYDLSDHKGTDRLIFRVELEQTWLEKEYTCFEEDRIDCYADDGGYDLSEFSVDSRARSRSMTLTESMQVTPTNPSAELMVATLPDGSTEFRVQTNQQVRRLLLGESGEQTVSDSIQYEWSYFSKSPSYWNGSGREHQPVFLHAYPARQYDLDPAYLGPELIKKAFKRTPGFSPEALPENVDVDRIASNYGVLDELVVESVDPYDESSVKALGITPGSEGDVTITRREVTKANISIERTGGNKTHAWFQVTLTEADGDPIRTENRPGTLIVDREEYQTDINGQVRVVTRRVGLIEAQFDPVEWYRLDSSTTAYSSAKDRAYTGVGRGLFALLYFLLRRTAPLWGSVLVILYFVDKTVDVQLWPPWRAIR